MAACPAFDPTGPYVSNLVGYVDCQGLAMGEAGYRSLGTGSAFGMVLTGLLTIYVALIGYRLLLGGEITVRGTVVTAVRLGLVLALATQWSAYRILVFDVVTRMPEVAAAGLTGPAGISSQGTPGIAMRYDLVDDAIAEVVRAQSAKPAPAGQQPGPVQPTTAPATAPGTDGLTWAMGTLSVTALAGLLSVRIITALMLALGPAFVACMLFETTRSLFSGWVRVLAGTFLAALAVPVVLNLELSVIEPQVLALRDLANSSQSTQALSAQLLATASLFGLMLIAVMFAMTRAGLAFRLPEQPLRDSLHLPGFAGQLALSAPPRSLAGAGSTPDPATSRALRIADAVQSLDWREARIAETALPGRTIVTQDAFAGANGAGGRGPVREPLGQQGRRTTRRLSAAINLRDERT